LKVVEASARDVSWRSETVKLDGRHVAADEAYALSGIRPRLREALNLKGEARVARLCEEVQELVGEMEVLALELKELILRLEPTSFLGRVWSLFIHQAMFRAEGGSQPQSDKATSQLSFLLEYAHAVWSCSAPTLNEGREDEDFLAALSASDRLRHVAFEYSHASSVHTQLLSPADRTGDLQFHLRMAWIGIRGNRYQIAEKEFFDYVLAPHDDMLRSTYGVGSAEVATGIQAIADAMREGHGNAFERILGHMETAERLGVPLEVAKAKGLLPEEYWAASAAAIEDVLMGGVCNVTDHSKLPISLLGDLAYVRGENREFFAPGAFSGTPLRTLPARIKPLVCLERGIYATDASFVRDASYRAIGRALGSRSPAYKGEWNRRQSDMSERAFAEIFATQLRSAWTARRVYYPTEGGQWAEVDSLIALDDALILVEAKAGGTPMHSPATDFDGHERYVRTLLGKAHRQCQSFVKYLRSASEVPLFELLDGSYVETRQVRYDGFRVILPLCLTVESYTPLSAGCKWLPGFEPLQGRHPFVVMAIDDLFILRRFLKTSGELFHYLEVRQMLAGSPGFRLYDEIDHLGGYVSRSTPALRRQAAIGLEETNVWSNWSHPVDFYFSEDRWKTEPPPSRAIPKEIRAVLAGLEDASQPGWLRANSILRDLSVSEEKSVVQGLRALAKSLLSGRQSVLKRKNDPDLMIRVVREDLFENDHLERRAKILTLVTGAARMDAILLTAAVDGGFLRARACLVRRPESDDESFAELLSEARRMKVSAGNHHRQSSRAGRNSPCWCGSGKKLKRCHIQPRP
jgi:hypothetical protein